MTAQLLPAAVALAIYAGAVPTGNLSGGTGSDSGMQLNAAGDKLAFVFQAISTTCPDKVSFHVSSVATAGSAGTIDCTIETMAADGTPSGTPVTNSATASVTASTTGVKNATGLSGTAVLVQGTSYALVIAAGTSWNRDLNIKITTGTSQGNLGFPYALTKDTAGSWTKTGGCNLGWCLGLADSGGTYMQVLGLQGAYSLGSELQFSDASNPDERGNRFSLAVPATCIGVDLIYNAGSTPGSTDNYAVALYSSHTATPSQLALTSMDGDAQHAGAPHRILFPAPVNLTAGTTYAVTIKATSSDNVGILRWDYQANADLAGVLGTSFYSTTRDGGAGAPANPGNNFTDDSAKIYSVFPIFSKFDDGTGGGSVAMPVSGRIVA